MGARTKANVPKIKGVKKTATTAKKARKRNIKKRPRVSKENARKVPNKTAGSNHLRDNIEKAIGSMFTSFAGELLRIPSQKIEKSPIEKLYHAVQSAAGIDDGWFESAAKDDLMNAAARFYGTVGIAGLASSRNIIATRRQAGELEIEYLLLVPEWDVKLMEAAGTTDEFHITIYLDSLTWPKARVISAGLDDDEERLSHFRGMKVYH